MFLFRVSKIFKKRNEGKLTTKEGFTLIELTVVLAVMAIILMVIAPNFSSVKDSAKAKVDKQNCAAIERSVEMLLAEDAISSSVTNIKITSSNGNVQVSGIIDDASKSKLEDLLEDLDKPQSGDSYNVDIEKGRKVTVSIV
ncbi:prepilin-type N-terminal cleavage/methylation domain-containing protein [Clostridium perfringens]|nr:prepilin-type N-terminal cleavage/methylation domain-containing protein [Clostridium perfringens]MDK0828663.1 prepilin-type N-terminal cleavage/methylation domain-containing protein [Clostridium perfringens]MDM0821732.1 prepilin-type N-terminal cleavage/methylation domain-containing protein [Clostridium perfringens]MDM0824630.1 prepilin-type N-terminal cleavage/methylation domain-containing protein [Clostridium perfringens]MDM0827726.1 prepilin-type N-terminal cleavage/methylation domain-con